MNRRVQSIATGPPASPKRDRHEATSTGTGRLGLVLALGFVILTQGGCYYGHLASGQLKVLWRRQPIEEVLRDPSTDDETRALLELVEPVRDFATELGLEVGDQYTSYVEWPGDRLVTTLVRTAPNSAERVEWWFPVIGHLPYKGFFDRERAEAEARRLRADGAYDVCVSGVTAYSTLGWLDDPVTTPMLGRGAASLVETLLHELVHATAFLSGAADFNESVAQFIGQQAAIQFFERQGDQDKAHRAVVPDAALPNAEKVRDAILDRREIASQTLAFREGLETLEGVKGRAALRVEAETAMRERLRALPLRVYKGERVAEKARLSDACLALGGTYAKELPRQEAVFRALGGDLNAMIQRLVLWAEEERAAESFFAVDDGGVASVINTPDAPNAPGADEPLTTRSR